MKKATNFEKYKNEQEQLTACTLGACAQKTPNTKTSPFNLNLM